MLGGTVPVGVGDSRKPDSSFVRSVLSRVLVAGLVTVFAMILSAGVSLAETGVRQATEGVVAMQQDQQPPPATPQPGPTPGAPGQLPAEQPNIGLAIAAAVLLGIVILGRRERTRRRKKAAG
jgi:amino acid transporter